MEALPADSCTTTHDPLRSWPDGRGTTAHDSHSSWLSGPCTTVNSPDDNNNHLRNVVVKGDFSAEKKSLRCPLLSDYSTLITDSTWIFEGHEASQQKPLIMSLLTTTVSKLKTFYRRCKHPRRRASCHECKNSKEEIRTSPPCQWGGGARGRQHGDKQAEGKQGHRWWHSSRTNKGGSRERGKGRSASHDGGGTVHTHSSGAQASSSNFLRKSLDTEYRGKQRKLRGSHRSRPVSSDDEGSDEVFESPPKYRDKPPRSKVSSKSEDTAQNSSKVSLKKSLQRNRSLSRSRLEGASRRMERDDSKSRRRLSHRKINKSSSSSSSSSSRSSSPTKSRPGSRSKSQQSKRKTKLTNGSLDREDFTVHQTSPEQYQTDLVQHQTDFVQNNADPVPHRTNFKVKDNTTDFLSRLDSVLSDLVEHEKKRISKFGQKNARGSVSKGVKNGSSERHQKAAEHKKNKGKKSDGVDKSASPSLQQLRTTLKAVRVKKRVPVPSDVLEKHSDYFTESLPHQPRILKSRQKSQLLSQRCYQPARRKPKPAPQDSSSDLYTSPAEDEHEEVKQVCEKQNDVSSEEEPEEYRETSEPSDSTYEREDEDGRDVFYRAEKPGKGGLDGYDERDQSTSDEHNYRRDQSAKGGSSVAARGVIKDLTSSSRGEAGDSGDFSVDSAYTGSRGATPESVLNPGVKPRRPGTGLANRRPASSASRHRLPVKARLEDQHLVEVKRVIMRDIRESGLYSDDSINALLERHRSRWPQLSRREMEHIVRSIQDDLGVKPHATHYVCQILAAAESGASGTPGLTKKIVEGPLCVSPLGEKTTKAQTKTYEAAVHPGQKIPSATQNLGAREPNDEEESRRPKKDFKEIEDELWARSVMSGVDPGLVDQARKEARAPHVEDDSDLPAYVMDLCQQFDVKI
ncbi:serine/arginine repetitive matrix protein 2-like [Penaeus monodon]|uniref:serine/arginine repetitive matrix protein 2-like n=1 Tax=Penaeus monodon TaxID=6687 RepID=UPI0018A74854|nr:serine/arginine repetitive matrix protein 2-like [Penaeus monodon]